MQDSTTKDERPKAVGYIRVSTEEQHISPEAQAERIESWAHAFGYALIETVADIAVTGSVPLADRPNGKRVAALIHSSRPWADAIVVTHLDRLGRDAEDVIGLVNRLTPSGRRRHNVALVSLDQHLDLSGPLGSVQAKLFAVLAEYERSMIGSRTSEALQHKKRAGRVYGGIPFGFDRDGDRLVPNEAEQRAIELMHRWRGEGINDHAISQRLNAEGVPTKHNKRWQANTVYNVLRRTAERRALPA